jgi:hypothetical protein
VKLRKKLTALLGIKLVAALTIAAALALLATAAYAAVGVKFTGSFKPSKPGKSAKVSVTIASSDPAAPQPPIMNRIQIKFPTGGKWNGSKFPKCSQAVLEDPNKGPNACPAKSKIGSGKGVGYAKPFFDTVPADLTLYNGGNSVLVWVFPTTVGPTFVTPCTIVGGYNLDCKIPRIQTLPNRPDAAVGTVNTSTVAKIIKKGKKKYPLIVTPKKCKGSWKSSATFSFATGEQVTSSFSEKCKKK